MTQLPDYNDNLILHCSYLTAADKDASVHYVVYVKVATTIARRILHTCTMYKAIMNGDVTRNKFPRFPSSLNNKVSSTFNDWLYSLRLISKLSSFKLAVFSYYLYLI